jgi:hypothetical protein
MYLPRRAVGHVFKTPVAHPQDAARVLAIDRACEEVHRASMSDDIFAVPVRERIWREVPVAGGRCGVASVESSRGCPRARLKGNNPPPPGTRSGSGRCYNHAYQVLICQGPKLTLSKLRRAEAIVGGAPGGGAASRS